MTFVHLHTHTDLSPKDAIAQVPAVVAKVADDGHPAIAITDHGSLGGMWALGKACRKHGIKPIPGFEAYLALTYETNDPDEGTVLADRWQHHTIDVPADGAATDGAGTDDADGATKTLRYHHLTVLARSRQGWSNLVALHNQGWEDNWRSPRIDHDMLAEHRDGLIVLTGCLGGPIQQPLMGAVPAMRALTTATGQRAEDLQEEVSEARALARRHLDWLIDAVGRDNVWVEVMYHGIDGEVEIVDELWRIADEYGLRCVATGDSHCLDEEHEHAQDAWLAIGSGKRMDDPKRWSFSGSGYHVKTEAEMRATSADHPLWNQKRWDEACSNTAVLAEQVADDVLPEAKMRLPKFPTPPGYDSSTAFFEELVWKGAEERWGTPLPQTHRDRLTYELQVIKDKGFPDYFLITQDVINWCRSDYTAEDWVTIHTGGTVDDATRTRRKRIRTGPGRGSGAGSAVSYCLGIVDADPIRYGLLFERFLSPDSVAMPDIDTDFEKGRRPEVLAFLRTRWGVDHVAQIGTYGSALSKAAIKAAARTLGETAKGEQLASLVPMKGPSPMPFSAFLAEDSEHGGDFRKAADCPEGEAILEIATAIEGAKSNESIHASAVLISSEPLTDLVPLRRATQPDSNGDPTDVWVARWEGGELEDFGMLKFDVLGLQNLDIITRCLDLLSADGIDVDLDGVDSDDLSDERVAETWRMLAEGRTSNVFQMESPGMTQMLVTAHPDRLEDLSSVIALYRPGPMGENQHTRWANIKAGRISKSYDQFTTDPAEQQVIASVLDASEGVIALQEQLMQLAEKISGFGPFTKSALRKAVSKKKADVLAKLEPLFIDGGQWTAPDGTIEDVPGGQVQFEMGDGTMSPGFSRATLETLWRTFRASGEYLFNKSHSIAYAKIGFWTAYLKASWPRQYAAAVLTTSDKDAHRSSILAEIRGQGIEVLPPLIDTADVDTRVIDGRIVYGIAETKRVSRSSAEALVAERSRAPFDGFADTVRRLVAGKVSAGDLELLIAAGGMDRFGSRREMTRIIRGYSKMNPKSDAPRIEPAPGAADWNPVERACRQRELLQVQLGDHPMSSPEVAAILSSFTDIPGGAARKVLKLSAVPKNLGVQSSSQFYAGVVTSWRELERPSGRFGFATIEDERDSVEVAVWFRTFAESRDNLPEVGALMVIEGRVEVKRKREGEEGEPDVPQLVAEALYRIDTSSPLSAPSAAPVPFDRALAGARTILLSEDGKGDRKVGSRKPDAARKPAATAPAPLREGPPEELAPREGSMLAAADVVHLVGVQRPVAVRVDTTSGKAPASAPRSAFSGPWMECEEMDGLRSRECSLDGLRHVQVRADESAPPRSEIRRMLASLPGMTSI